jgi:hypothetical protein
MSTTLAEKIKKSLDYATALIALNIGSVEIIIADSSDKIISSNVLHVHTSNNMSTITAYHEAFMLASIRIRNFGDVCEQEETDALGSHYSSAECSLDAIVGKLGGSDLTLIIRHNAVMESM